MVNSRVVVAEVEVRMNSSERLSADRICGDGITPQISVRMLHHKRKRGNKNMHAEGRKKIYNRKSLRTKLIVGVLFLLLSFLMIVYVIWSVNIKRNTEKTLIENTRLILEGENSLLETQIEEVKKLMLQTSIYAQGTQSLSIMHYLQNDTLTPKELYEYRKQCNSYLVSICGYENYLKGLTVANLDGRCLTYGLTYPYEAMLDENWYQENSEEQYAFTLKKPYFQDGVEHKTSHVFSLICSISGDRRQKPELRVAELSYNLLTDVLRDNESFDVGVIDTQTKEKIYIAGKNNTSESLDASEISEKIGDAQTGSFRIKANNRTFWVVFSNIKGTNWYTLGAIPLSTMNAYFWQNIIKVLAVTLLLFCVLLALVLYVILYYTKNIKQLTNAVKTMDENKLVLDVDIHSGDEVEELTAEFRHLLGRISNLIEQVKETEKEKKNSELAALQYQINPHFMYNTLNTVKYLAELNGMENICQVTESFMELMYINMSKQSFIRVTDECAYLNNYILIQNYRYIHKINFEISCDEEVENALIPKLLLQPLVENALLHGINHMVEHGFIKVSFRECFGKLCIIIEDNGAGMTEEEIEEMFSGKKNPTGHIGVKNVKDRIILNYGTEAEFKIYSEKGRYTKQVILIPLNEN